MRSAFAVWLIVASLIYAAVNYYVWVRLLRNTALSSRWQLVLSIVFVCLAMSVPAVFIGARAFGLSFSFAFWPALLWSAVVVLLLFFLGSTDLVRALVWLVQRLTNASSTVDPERRLFISRMIAGGATALSFGMVAYGAREALGGVSVRRVAVTLGRLPAALNGMTIAQITDLHVGRGVGKSYVEEVVRQVNNLRPDIIAITGDLADGSPAELAEAVQPLAQLHASHGVYFVAGNHDHYSGIEPWKQFLRQINIQVLHNQRVSIEHKGHFLELAGVDDPAGANNGGGPDVAAALAGVDPTREVVLLAHRPSEIFAAAKEGVGLQLSGHTHGGQFWPFTWFAHLVFPYVSGLHQHDNTQIYVSRGAGYVGPPVRVGAPAELTLVELHSVEATT
ncbi:MAG: hypothetical protein A2289_10565 [Deltaproteobacteria bacterium RIFOXYA12_FULL_58_15]|nr:MAG: hypothetical protein A2289_10565 [Deltaproteobacteria bacterium RIFOXYA12_FULL_58_15]OGR11944.1 MAG: hypothetical protein A2341_17255 [Deltaproteobacteria bacterium RIFOXYB12_FULL_58_9]